MPPVNDRLVIRTLINKVPLCGCGSSSEMWTIVRDVLARAPGHTDLSFFEPMPERDLSATAVEFVAQVLSETGLLEHGSSIGFAWLTPGGEMLLAFLREYGTESHLGGPWPEWALACDASEPFCMTWEELRKAGIT